MRADIPSYVVHYKGNDRRRLLLQYIHDLENFENVTWVLDNDKEEITYEMYVENFKADHYEWQLRKQDPNEFFPHYPLQPAMVSLCLKQKDVFGRIGYGEAEYGILFEDDAIICKDFLNEFDKYFKELPSDWDVAFIGQGANKRIPKEQLVDGVHWYKKSHPADRCADSVLFKKESARKIFEMMQKHKICFNPDPELGFWMKILDMNVYWLEPPIVVQGSQNGLFETVQPAHSRYVNEEMKVRDDLEEIVRTVLGEPDEQ